MSTQSPVPASSTQQSLQQMNVEQRADFVSEQLIPMLKNDLRVLIESGCPEHGCRKPDGSIYSAPSFSIALVCMISCEALGSLASPGNINSEPERTQLFLARVGQLAGDPRYDQYSRLLIALFRNGVAHSFLPKQRPEIASGTTWAAGWCIDHLAQVDVSSLRSTIHLSENGPPNERTFRVVAQLLYLDVVRAIDDFTDDLRRREPSLMAVFPANFDRWLTNNERLDCMKYLTPAELKILCP